MINYESGRRRCGTKLMSCLSGPTTTEEDVMPVSGVCVCVCASLAFALLFHARALCQTRNCAFSAIVAMLEFGKPE